MARALITFGCDLLLLLLLLLLLFCAVSENFENLDHLIPVTFPLHIGILLNMNCQSFHPVKAGLLLYALFVDLILYMSSADTHILSKQCIIWGWVGA